MYTGAFAINYQVVYVFGRNTYMMEDIRFAWPMDAL